jgi:hypothetical protein
MDVICGVILALGVIFILRRFIREKEWNGFKRNRNTSPQKSNSIRGR